MRGVADVDEQDGQIARQRVPPQHRPPAGVACEQIGCRAQRRVRIEQQREEARQGRQCGRLEAALEQLLLGAMAGELVGPIEIAERAVAARELQRGFARIGDGGDERQLAGTVRWQLDRRGEDHGRVERRARRARQPAGPLGERGRRGVGAAAPDECGARAVVAEQARTGARQRQHMDEVLRALVGRARPAVVDQGAVLFEVLALDEELAEGGMALIGGAVAEHDFAEADDGDAASAAFAAQRQVADLDVGIGRDEDALAHREAAVAGVVLDRMRREEHTAAPRLGGGRIAKRRPDAAVSLILQVDAKAVIVERRIRRPARQRQAAPATASAARVGGDHAELAVRQHVRLRERRIERRRPRCDRNAAHRTGGAPALELRLLDRRAPRQPLVQQQFCRLAHGLGVKAPDQCVAVEKVVQCGEHHALMVGHERAHDRRRVAGAAPIGRKIDRFVQPVATDHPQLAQVAQVGDHLTRHQRQREQ